VEGWKSGGLSLPSFHPSILPSRQSVNLFFEKFETYRLPLINQIQVNPAIGLDFAKVLRAVLRQDPDVILVGEIRDLETTEIATEAALTGHLVFSSLHTNNAIDAVTRLVEIGVEPFMVAPSIIGILAQRLGRRICPKCKEAYVASPEEMFYFGLSANDPPI